jgi:hypothetical protein
MPSSSILTGPLVKRCRRSPRRPLPQPMTLLMSLLLTTPSPAMPIVVGDSQICLALTGARRAKASKNDVDVDEAITMTLCDGDVEGLFAGR